MGYFNKKRLRWHIVEQKASYRSQGRFQTLFYPDEEENKRGSIRVHAKNGSYGNTLLEGTAYNQGTAYTNYLHGEKINLSTPLTVTERGISLTST